MKKLTDEEKVNRELLASKYQYPAYCTTYNKNGSIKGTRVVTHNVKATKELKIMFPSLIEEINRITKPKEEHYKPFTLAELGR